MDNTRLMLQVPITNSLKTEAFNVAQELGFSSLQDLVRLLLTKLANREISINVGPNRPDSASEAAIARYDQLVADVKSGKVKTVDFSQIDQALDHLDTL